MRPRKPYYPTGTTARQVALQILLESQHGESFIQECLDRHLSQVTLSASDRRLVTQLAYGVVRRRGALDALLRPLVTRGRQKVEEMLWEVLRIGAFQLLYLAGIPAHAAINETVELAGDGRRARARGFVNAVLRKMAALVTAERRTEPSPCSLPLEDGQYMVLAQAVLPDPGTRPVEYLAAAFSLPRWLAERWLTRYGEDECRRLGFWFAGPAPLWLRCNPLRTERAALLTALAAANIRAEPGEHPLAIRLAEHIPVRQLPGYDQGWFTVQDEAGMQAATALEVQPGMKVLDLCAAPGGKTTALAERMRNEGTILACDRDAARLDRVTSLCQRLGISIVHAVALTDDTDPPAGPFDAVLVDAPCSNTGVLGRRPEVRWRLRPEEIQRLRLLQTKLLLQACERIRPGGKVVYSTCSIEPEENGAVVRTVLTAMRGMTLDAEQQQVPGKPADGGYWASLRRER